MISTWFHQGYDKTSIVLGATGVILCCWRQNTVPRHDIFASMIKCNPCYYRWVGWSTETILDTFLIKIVIVTLYTFIFHNYLRKIIPGVPSDESAKYRGSHDYWLRFIQHLPYELFFIRCTQDGCSYCCPAIGLSQLKIVFKAGLRKLIEQLSILINILNVHDYWN